MWKRNSSAEIPALSQSKFTSVLHVSVWPGCVGQILYAVLNGALVSDGCGSPQSRKQWVVACEDDHRKVFKSFNNRTFLTWHLTIKSPVYKINFLAHQPSAKLWSPVCQEGFLLAKIILMNQTPCTTTEASSKLLCGCVWKKCCVTTLVKRPKQFRHCKLN